MDPEATVRVVILPDGRMDRKNATRYTGLSGKIARHACVPWYGPAFKRGKVFYFRDDVDRWIQGKVV